MNNRNTFKKIYFEITNRCNLNCSFCLKSKNDKRSISFDEFKYVLSQIKPYTKYLYFHVLGEPLIHSDINKFIEYASNDFYINITTNGYLINNLKTDKIRQLNVSLHSFDDRYNKSLEDYLNDIFLFQEKYSKFTYINYRLWVENKNYNKIIDIISKHYNVNIPSDFSNIKLCDNVYLNSSNKFDWPDDNTSKKVYQGVCYALKDHVAVLSNGNVTACCLDGNGALSFGNIFTEPFSKIISSERFAKMKKDLMLGKRTEDICKKCNFLFRE